MLHGPTVEEGAHVGVGARVAEPAGFAAREDAAGRVLASETLVANAGVRACIRERRWEQLVGLIEIGGKEGMHTIDDDLQRLYLAGLISKEEAVANARDRAQMAALRREPAARRGLFG